MHTAVEVASVAVAGLAISDERANDARFLMTLVLQMKARSTGWVKRMLTDSVHDKRESFDFVKEEGIEAGSKLRSSASRKSLEYG